jgi:cytochrome c553
MTPHPPDLSETAGDWDDEELFTIVMHGVKFTGMPAWPAQEREDEAWAMVAFLRRLPSLSEDEYRELVAPHEEAADGAPEIVVEQCARCHGVDGHGRGEGAFPRLAGQRQQVLLESLRAYAEGARHSGIMEPIAAELDEAQMGALAQWYASRKPAELTGERDPVQIAKGAAIAARGIPERKIPPCVPCHGPTDHETNEAFPTLNAQQESYLALQLELFVEGRRGGSKWAALMDPVVAHDLNPEEIRAVAAFYASLGAPAASSR